MILQPETLMDKGSWSSLYMWLSDDPISPLCLDDQKLQDIRDLYLGRLSLDCDFSSIGGSPVQSRESILDRSPIFDGSPINPIDEARMILNKTLKDIDGLQESEEVSWLHKSLKDDKQDSSIISFESVESSFDPYLIENSSVSKRSSKYATTHEDSCGSQDFECDRVDDWVSVPDTQDDLEFVQDKGQLYDVFSQPDFPSPTFRINLLNDHGGPVNEGRRESVDSEEPLFWPYDSNFCCYPQIEWNGLCISPIKSPVKMENPNGARRPIRLKVLDKKGSLLDRRKGQVEDRRNVCGSGTAKPKVVEVRSGSTGMSRLSCLNPEVSHVEEYAGQKANKRTDKKSNSASRSHLVKPLMPRRSNEIQRSSVSAESHNEIQVGKVGQDKEVPIEKQIGLDEFDGHEGIADVEEVEGIQFDLD